MDTILIAKEGLAKQIEGLQSLSNILNKNFETICNVLAKASGRIIISGVGKSGHIGKKISSTMSSIGIPSFFLNPSEASHGDLGMIVKGDILILISNSGETKEFTNLLNFINKEKFTSVAITRAEFSTLSNSTTYKIVMPQSPEIVSYGAPTTSTTQTLIIGDLLAVCVSKLKGFSSLDYARIHPGGKLGLSLSLVFKSMRKREECSVFKENASFKDILLGTKFGIAIIEDFKGSLLGVMTDGDIRRIVAQNGNVKNLNYLDLINKNPIMIDAKSSLIQAIEIFNEKKIGTIIVVEKGKFAGIIDRKDIEF